MKISFPRGDLYKQRFTVTNSDGTPCEINFDEIYFTVKRNYTDRDILFQKRLTVNEIVPLAAGEYQFTIFPADTDSLQVGNYVFDIELVSAENEIKRTATGEFILTNEVTFASNEG